MQGKKEARRIEAIIRHYLETGDDTSQSELAYKPAFPHPTKEELKAALSEAVGKRERDRPRATLPSGVGTLSLARAKAACEVYSRILELGRSPKERRELLERFGRESHIAGRGEQREELPKNLSAAVDARNGWKRILKLCLDDKPKRWVFSISSPKPPIEPGSMP